MSISVHMEERGDYLKLLVRFRCRSDNRSGNLNNIDSSTSKPRSFQLGQERLFDHERANTGWISKHLVKTNGHGVHTSVCKANFACGR